MLNRRVLFGYLTAALTLVAGSVAVADRYQNQSGLAPGSFVWSPSIAPEGALAIVVSPSERTVHVYRDGMEIAISTATVPSDAVGSAGVFVISEIEGGGREASTSGPVWRGTQLQLGSASQVSEGGIGMRLPRDFAELLSEVTYRGAAVIVARERTEPQLFSAPGPFVDPVETGSLNRVARFARPELRPQIAPPEPSQQGDAAAAARASGDGVGSRGQITSLILSRADLSAYVMKDGLLVDRLPISVEDPTRPLGLHAAVLVSSGDERREAKWLAFGIDDDKGAAHVVADEAERALRRVRFLDKGRSSNLARTLSAGSVVVLVDGHGPSATEAPRLDVVLLQSDDASPQPSGVGSKPIPPQDVAGEGGVGMTLSERTNAAPNANPSSASKQARSSPKPQSRTVRRRRGPLDQREEWPNSMYWPY